MNAAEAVLGGLHHRGLHDKPAILYRDRSVTYGEIDAEASRFAGFCRSAGLQPGDRVLLLVDDGPEFFQVFLGAMKAGLVPVPVNFRMHSDELRHIVDDSAGRIIVVDGDKLAPLAEALKTIEDPPLIITTSKIAGQTSLADATQGHSAGFEPTQLAPDDTAFWMYSSGTTGRPKAAVHLQRTVPATDRYFREVFGVTGADRVYSTSKLFFAYALGHSVLATLRLGAAAVLSSGWPTPATIADEVARHSPTVMLSVPTLYRNMLRQGVARNAAFKDVRLYISAGERLPESVFDGWHEATGGEILEGLGTTETLMMVLANRPGDCKASTVGVPLPGVETRLAGEQGDPVTDAHAPGVLWVRCGTNAAEYWNQPDRSKGSFKQGWFRSGDVFVIDKQGRYRHQGRSDDMLKVSGQWISPVEIERQVLADPGVREAVVVGVADRDGLERLALCLVPEAATIDRAELEARLSASLRAKFAIYKCPRRFLYLDSLPHTDTGKIQRHKLRAIAAERLGEHHDD